MNAQAPDPRDQEILVDIRSELEFPIDATLAGARLRWQPGTGRMPRWSFSAQLLTNLADPGEKTTDRDFVAGREVVHSESDPQVDLWFATFASKYLLYTWGRTSFSLVAHFEYQHIEQYIVGFEGWQKSLFSETKIDISNSDPALDYRVTYVSTQLGASLDHRIVDRLQFEFQSSLGIVFATDHDNHILRNRISEGDATGLGLNSLIKFDFLPGSLPLPWLSAQVAGGLTYFYAEGGMDQFFADGSSYIDLPYTLESLQPQISVSVGAAF
jgi:hypothetical protein